MKPLISHDDLSAAQQGDRLALDRVLAQSRSILLRCAKRHCAMDDVDDAVQESLIAVSRKLGDLRNLDSYVSWMLRIVKRECHRLMFAKRAAVGDGASDERERCAAFQLEWRHDVVAALRSLPAHHCRVLWLREMEGLTIAEIAARLTHSNSAVKSRLHRARALARDYLGDDFRRS